MVYKQDHTLGAHTQADLGHFCYLQVEDACRMWLVQTFYDLHKVVTDDELRQAFMDLCPRAVCLWMECNQLAGTEDEVLALLTIWHAGPQVCCSS